MVINTLIVEDEANARQALKNMLEFYCEEVHVKAEATTVAQAIEQLQNHDFQLVFLDIDLPDGKGFEILKKVKHPKFNLVFVTAHDEYALEAIKLSALDYILKPINPKDLIRAINKVQEATENEELIKLQIETCSTNFQEADQEKKIILNAGSKMHFLEIKDIIRAQAQENYSQVVSASNPDILVSKRMKELEEVLVANGFFRVHHSHLINLKQISTYDKSSGEITMQNGDKVPVSTRRKDPFLKALQKLF